MNSTSLVKTENSSEEKNKKRRRMLILSTNIGNGHNTASKAIKEGMEYLHADDFFVEIIDFGEILSSSIGKAAIKVYEESIKYVPSIYKYIFKGTNKTWQIKLINLIKYPFTVKKLRRFFEEKNPDIIVSTHPLWDYIAVKIWKKQNSKAKFVSLITDSISIHSACVAADTDYHIVANKDTAEALKAFGISKTKIKILGFPIGLEFLKETNKKSLFKEFGLDQKNITLIFLATSESYQKSLRTLEEIYKKTANHNIIIVTGKNSDLTEKLTPYRNQKNTLIFEWTNRLADFIKTCDMVITKPGGATIMECIAAKKPMIITHIIPGHETGNAELIKRYNLGIVTPSTKQSISESIDTIEKNYPEYQKNLAQLSNPGSALDIAKFLASL